MFIKFLNFVNENFRIVNPALIIVSSGVLFFLERRHPFYLPVKNFLFQRRTNIGLGLIFTLTIFFTGFINYLSAKYSGILLIGLFYQPFFLKHLPYWLSTTISFLIIDMVHFLAHLLLHKSDFLWRFHAVHHSDGHLDVSTGLRFHPGDAFFTNILVASTIFIFGLNFGGAILYGVVETVFILFIHSNLKTENSVWKVLQLWIATPYLQAIHHSKVESDQESNFGIVFSFWDRIFGTLRLRAIQNKKITLGITEISHKQARNFQEMLFYPFKTK